MKINLANITVRDVFNGYVDSDDDGIFAYNGNLSIRPPYQRNFVYNPAEEEAVIHTVLKKYPLNVMYWVKTAENSYEILDGQQRTLSLMHFLDHKFAIKLNGNSYYCDTLTDDQFNSIIDYPLMVYICEDGTESEKLEWFEVVNIAGKKLTTQELLNKSYTGPWLLEAKRIFSKRNCAAKGLSDKYIAGDPNRQELLEKALRGISSYKKLPSLSEYMAIHKNDTDADELWQYFQDVIAWVTKIFPIYFKNMKGIDWCELYNKYSQNSYNSSKIAEECKKLNANEDDEIGNTKGIYEFLLSRDNDPYAGKLLNLRVFKEKDKAIAYNRQQGLCNICKKQCDIEEMEGDHILPWSKGGKTTLDNLQMLCRSCNSKKSDKY